MLKDIIKQFSDGKISGKELCKEIISHEPWHSLVHTSHGEQKILFAEDQGQQYTQLFSSQELLNNYFQKIDMNSDKTEITGEKLIKSAPEIFLEIINQPIDFIDIDPGSEWALHYTKDQFDLLKEMATSLL